MSPVDEISLTLPLRTSWRKVGLYGTLIRFSGGANTATISQFRTNRAMRMVMKRRGLQGIMGGFFGRAAHAQVPALRVGRRRCGAGIGGASLVGHGPMLGVEAGRLPAPRPSSIFRPYFAAANASTIP